MTVLVTGATGSVGRVVVNLLLAAGAEVRATSRDPESARLPEGVDVRPGDLADPAAFGAALTGVEGMFLFPEPSGVEGILRLAVMTGVARVVLLSSAAVTSRGSATNPIALMHRSVEQAVEHSGLPHTFLRPGTFASNSYQWAPAIKAGAEVRIAYAEASVVPIHEGDIAAVAVHALLADGSDSAIHDMTGPESLTQRRQVELLAEVTGRPVSVVDLTGDAARAHMHEQYGSFGVPGLADAVVDILAATVGHPAPVTHTVKEVTGQPARSFAQWAEEHKDAFLN